MRAAGIHPVTNADYTYVYGPCDTFTLYDSLLRATAGDATAAMRQNRSQMGACDMNRRQQAADQCRQSARGCRKNESAPVQSKFNRVWQRPCQLRQQPEDYG